MPGADLEHNGQAGSFAVADDMVDHQGGFFAVDRKTGRGLWRFPALRPGEENL
jgi:outer membrane protein assembly factor BamB